jgi:uncharacterized protein with GYD domain
VPTYISLINFTDQGIRSFKDSPKRAKAFTEMVEQMGGKVNSIHWTLGSYDLVTVVEAPDDATYTAASLKVAALGNVRTTTLKAFNEKEITQIINKVG